MDIVDYAAGYPTVWLAVLTALACWLAFARRPRLPLIGFLGVFGLGAAQAWNGRTGYAGVAVWILALAVVLDANSRRPIWGGLGATLVTLVASLVPLVIGIEVHGSIPGELIGGVLAATLAGQVIRAAFAAARAGEAEAAARLAAERLELRHAIHDSGSARLAQLMLLSRRLREHPELPAALRSDVDLLADVAAAGAQELRAAMQPRTDSSPELAREWRRSLEVLRTAGFDVVETLQPLPSLTRDAEEEAARVVREATSNICRHAAEHGRVLAAATARHGTLALTWLSDRNDTAAASGGGLGISGMSERVRQLGGSVETALVDGCFRLTVTLPLSANG